MLFNYSKLLTNIGITVFEAYSRLPTKGMNLVFYVPNKIARKQLKDLVARKKEIDIKIPDSFFQW